MNSQSRLIGLFALIAASVVLWWQPIAATFSLALSSDAHTHIFLIVPLGLALVYVQGRGKTPAYESGKGLSLTLLVASLLLRVFTLRDIVHLSSSDLLSLNMLALVIWWIGSVILCYGIGTFKKLLFPLCLLFLIVPLPDHAVNWITGILQHESATATTWLFRCARIPVQQDGVFLSIPGLNIEVASECSSIRSSIMLVVTTLILAQLFLRSWWRKAVLVAAAIPLSVAKNAIRIFTIATLTTRVDPSYFEGHLHRQGGILFLALGVGAILALLWGLRKNDTANLSAHS